MVNLSYLDNPATTVDEIHPYLNRIEERQLKETNNKMKTRRKAKKGMK
jgi:hypothetical protein